jgi:hypothetical protein
MSEKTRLNNIAVGDIFRAASAQIPSIICLVTSVTKMTIDVRTITTQRSLRFDRRTGEAAWETIEKEQVICTIDSVAPLPVNIHNIMLGLDRKIRLGGGPESNPLDRDEIEALLFLDSHYPSNPLW